MSKLRDVQGFGFGSDTHLIKSEYVDQTYEIHVCMPFHVNDDNQEIFPVLYMPDADSQFGVMESLSNHLQEAGFAPRFILVGIGYPGNAKTSGWGRLRARDLMYMPLPLREKVTSLMQKAMPDTKLPDNIFNGASDFLQFVTKELMPFIDAQYPTRPNDRAYFGHSGGGSFGFYTLLNQPKTFNRYILGSPGIVFHEDEYMIEDARAFIASGKSINAKLYMSVGSHEQFETVLLNKWTAANCDLGYGFYKMAKLLYEARMPDLELHTEIFTREPHYLSWINAFSHGVQAVFGPSTEPLAYRMPYNQLQK